MDPYKFEITKVRDDKVEILISSRHSRDRQFDIIVHKDGLVITIDNELAALPRASNSIRIDYAAWFAGSL